MHKPFSLAIKIDRLFLLTIHSRDYLDFHFEEQMPRHRKCLHLLQIPLLFKTKVKLVKPESSLGKHISNKALPIQPIKVQSVLSEVPWSLHLISL